MPDTPLPQPISEIDFFKKRLSAIERLAATKQQQMKSLQDITEAINHNMPIYALVKIYENILRAHQGVGKVILFMKESEEKWVCELVSETAQKVENVFACIKVLSSIATIQAAKNHQLGHLNEFDFVIPVMHKKEPVGFAMIGGIKETQGDVIEDKLKFIQTITNIIVVANENKKLFKSQLDQMLMQKELRVAEEMQKMLVPRELPATEKVEVAAYYKAHKSIGGDYYDFIQLDNDEIAFCVSDVSGKGISAALLMANLQANLRALITRNYPLDQLVDILNSKIREITQGEKYITFFIGIFDYKTRLLRYVNAGHTSSLLNSKGEIMELDKGCTILGMFEILPYINVGETYVPPNSVIVNYTDGLSEASDPDGNLFESDRIENFLRQNPHLTVQQFNEQLIDEMLRFTKGTEFDDDLTLLTLRIK